MSARCYELHVDGMWVASVDGPVPTMGSSIRFDPDPIEPSHLLRVTDVIFPIEMVERTSARESDPIWVFAGRLDAPYRMLAGHERPPAYWPLDEAPRAAYALDLATYDLHVGNQRFAVDVGAGTDEDVRIYVADVQHEDFPEQHRVRGQTVEQVLELAARWAMDWMGTAIASGRFVDGSWVDEAAAEGGAPCAS